MTAVWYTKPGDRNITAAQWAAAGIAGAADVSWDKTNGWSVPAASFTAPQLTLLAADGGFNTNAPDGPNTNRNSSSGNTGGTVQATKADIDAALLQAATLDSGTPLARLLRAITHPIRRMHLRPLRLGPVSTDITSAANNATADATLTQAYALPVTGLVDGQARALTAAEVAALPFDPGQGRPQVYRSGGIGYYMAVPGTANIDLATQGQWPWIAQKNIRFMTDCDKVDVLLWALLGTSVSGYQVFIDGVPQSLNPTVMSAAVTYLHLIFPTAKPRLVEIRTDCLVSTMFLKPGYKIWKPAPMHGPRMMIVGSSYSSPTVYNGTTGAADMMLKGLWQQIGDYIDIEDVWIDGVGGTGFIVRASGGSGGPNNNYMDRMPGILIAKPDILVIDNAFANDSFQGQTTAAVIAAANAFMVTLRQSLPNTKVVFMTGIRAPLYGDFTTNYAAIMAGLQALRQDIYYIDTGLWLDMAGYVPGHTSGQGNSNVYIGQDGVHATPEGHAYLRYRMASVLQRIMYDDGRLVNSVLAN
jgi:hypothetical protein